MTKNKNGKAMQKRLALEQGIELKKVQQPIISKKKVKFDKLAKRPPVTGPSSWTDIDVNTLLEIFENNRDYSFTHPGLGLCGHVSNLLINLYQVDKTREKVQDELKYFKNTYWSLTREHSKGRTHKTWGYFDRVRAIIKKKPVDEQMDTSLELPKLTTLSLEDWNVPLAPGDTWTCHDLDMLLTIFETNLTFRFAVPHPWMCTVVSKLLEPLNVNQTGIQVQSKLTSLNKKVKESKISVSDEPSQNPYFERIKVLHFRI